MANPLTGLDDPVRESAVEQIKKAELTTKTTTPVKIAVQDTIDANKKLLESNDIRNITILMFVIFIILVFILVEVIKAANKTPVDFIRNRLKQLVS